MSDEVQGGTSRRNFLRNAALSALPVTMATTEAHAMEATEPPAQGLIIRQREPENLEAPFSDLKGFLTPTSQFYVRNHFAAPQLEANAWHLKVEGTVQNPLSLSYEELRQMPTHTVTTTLECAGNGRVQLTPAARGVQWDQGAVSTAEWTGVSLATVLERAGLKRETVEIVLEGADSGEIKDPPKPGGILHFSRSLPLEKARDKDTLLVYKMNGENLSPAHGFPVRAIVPGWYGMASVKWLTRIVAVEKPFMGYYQTVDYAFWEMRDGMPNRTPITEMQIKATIAHPVFGETLPAGKSYRIHGAAWAGEADITQVEVSTDGGKVWSSAKLYGRSARYSWRLWEYAWQVPSQPGNHTLMVRATDSKGRTQPIQRDGNRENYIINHILPTRVTVR